MNRRSFFGRIGAAAAVPVLAQVATAAENVPVDPAPATLGGDSQGKRVILPQVGPPVPKPFYEDRLTLLQRRGLMAPCPNCGTTNWFRGGSSAHVQCGRCDWIVRASAVEQPCGCSDCLMVGGSRYAAHSVDATLRDVQWDASPGLYRICEPGSPAIKGRPIVKYETNAYDVHTDDYVHDAVLERLARVVCAVRALDRFQVGTAGIDDRVRQPGGDLVVFGWRMVDCYEWQVQRGEKPPITYHRDASGRATFVQGTK